MTTDRLAAFARHVDDISVYFYPGHRAIVAALCDVAKAAQAYRTREGDDTPRMFRGKELHDLSLTLDSALDRLSTALAEPTTEQKERS